MASDLSLIEISSEDDSLLQQPLRNEDATKSFFSCSPLQIGGSSGPRLPPIGSINKENVNVNKSEMPKLNLEPQQMKRKKKAGGFNLRKSLAWNRAFFTEEGVLDPLELSMISGSVNSSTGGLPVIHEGGRESLSEFPDHQSDSGDWIALEEKLFKGSPRSTKIEHKTTTNSIGSPIRRDTSAKSDKATVSLTKRKVLLNSGVDGSRSKRSGYPKPNFSSSLKRPANVNSTKAVPKETKVSKPVRKLDSSLHTSITQAALPAGTSKRNQPAQRGTTQRNANMTGPSSILTSHQSNITTGPRDISSKAKSVGQKAKRNMLEHGKRGSAVTLSSRPNKGRDMRNGPDSKSAHGPSHVKDAEMINMEVSQSQSQSAQFTGEPTQHVQFQPAKPSSLRMPSPSLGFFCQVLNNSTQSSCASRSGIHSSENSKVKSFCTLKPTQGHEKVPEMTSYGKSQNLVLSTSTAFSARSLKPEESQNMPSRKVEMLHEVMENPKILYRFLKDGEEGLHMNTEMHREEMKAQLGDGEIPMDENVSLHIGPCKEKEKINSEKVDNKVSSEGGNSTGYQDAHPLAVSLNIASDTKDVCMSSAMIERQHSEEPQCFPAEDLSVFSLSPTTDATICRHQVTSVVKVDCAGARQFSEGGKVVGSHANDNNHRLQEENEASLMGVRSSEQFQKLCEEDYDNLNDRDDATNKEERSHSVHMFKSTNHAENDLGNYDSSGQSCVELSKKPVLDGSLTTGHGSSLLMGDPGMIDADGYMQFTCHALEVAQEDKVANENDDLLTAVPFSGDDCSEGVLPTAESEVHIVSSACGSQLNSTFALCPLHPFMQVDNSDEAKTVEDITMEANQSVPKESEPKAEYYISSLDIRSTCDFQLQGPANSSSVGTSMNKEQVAVAATNNSSNACVIGLADYYCSRTEGKDSDDLILVVDSSQDKSDPSVSLMESKESEHVGEKELTPPVKNVRITSNMQLGDEIAHWSQDMGNNDSMVSAQLADLGTLTQSSSGDVDDVSCPSGSFEQPQIMNTSKKINASLQFDGPSPQEDAERLSDESDCAVFAVQDSSLMAVQERVPDGSLSDCSNEMNSLPPNSHLTMANNLDKESDHQDKIHPSYFAGENVSLLNQQLPSTLLNAENSSKERNVVFERSVSLCLKGVSNSDGLKTYDCPQLTSAMQDKSGDIGRKGESDIHNFLLDVDGFVDAKRDQLSLPTGADDLESAFHYTEEASSVVKSVQKVSGAIIQTEEASYLKSISLHGKTESSVLEGFDDQKQDQFRNTLHPTEDNSASVPAEISKNDLKQDSVTVKPPPDAVPFSDEWLAAYEGAGEEILKMKSGAVQNSPPDKNLPEPGPWSPVKRKNNQAIGPFDCTKYTNTSTSDPPGSPP